MKIVFIGGRDIHQIGGIENYMYNLATQLVRKGHEPIVFCESDHEGEETVNGFKVIHHKSPKSVFVCKIWLGLKSTLHTLLHFKDVDMIHYNAWPPAIPAIYLARLCGKRALIMGHGHDWQRTKYGPLQQKLMRIMELLGVRSARYRLMCSDAQKKYFMDRYGLESTTMPTAINLPDDGNVIKSDILSRFNLSSGKYFLYLARLVQDKNPDYLIKAFNCWRPEGYKLVIAGNNPAAPGYVKELHDAAAGNEDIVFTDAIFGDDKVEILRNAYAFCIPSTIEGLSISLLEAMSYGLPIIASDIPANREALEDDMAIWVRPENVEDIVNAYRKSIQDKDWFLQTAIYNRDKIVTYYNWESISERYINVLRDFIAH